MLLSGDSLENKTKMMPKYVLWFWLGCWVMFGLSFFTSKSGLSIFSSLLIITSVFYVNWKSFSKEKWLVLMVLSLPLGMFLNLFSLGGAKSSLEYLKSNPWVLTIIPGYHLVSQRSIKWFLYPLLLSLLAAIVKSGLVFYTDFKFLFSSSVRVQSFFDIGRWGQFIGAAAVALLPFCYRSESYIKCKTWVFRVLFLLSAFCLLLSNTRGPWLGFFVAAAVVIILMRRHVLLIGSLSVVILVSGFSFNSGLKNRISSIIQVQDVGGIISSTDRSNAGRLHMWSVALDFYKEQPWFGVGMKSMEAPLQDFLIRKGENYRNKYLVAEFSHNDAHSSYLQSLVEMGVVFFIYLWGLYFGLMIFTLNKILVERNKSLIAPLALLVFSAVVFVFYSSYASYESLVTFVLVPLWFFYVSNNTSKKLVKMFNKYDLSENL